MNKIFSSIKAAIVKVYKFITGDKAKAAIDKAVSMVPQALAIVQAVAALTPNRTDDEIVALCKAYALPWVEKYLAVAQEKRGLVLLDAATQVLAKQFPNATTSILNAAIQVAYTGWRAEQE